MLRSRPIKGTRRRGSNADSDAASRDDLARSEKDAAENRMIVDLTRHDLARSCLPGSVAVPEFLRIEEHPAVFQLVSEVRGRRAPGISAAATVAACFPGGSMTGAPKERTVELLARLEKEPRGIYSGSIGYFTRGGAFTLSMAIRVLENRGRAWRVGCGGAILADSDAASEWREAVVKARSVIDAAGGMPPG
jgi:para-aminobenzoate synthetase